LAASRTTDDVEVAGALLRATARARSEIVVMDWNAFEAGLASPLPTVEANSVLLVSVAALPPVYVQFTRTDRSLLAQTGADDVFPSDHRLGSVGAERLRALGWLPPDSDPSGGRTWHAELPWPGRTAGYKAMAARCTQLFRDIHAVSDPDQLEYRAWREPELPPDGVTYHEEDIDPGKPHLVLPDLPIRDVGEGSTA
jgi:hypothetical protein